MLKIKSQSIEDIGDFVIKQLRNIEGIAKTKTIAVFRKVKETVSLPI
jgi:DNA-binding Lrp family transcriptional regulator